MRNTMRFSRCLILCLTVLIFAGLSSAAWIAADPGSTEQTPNVSVFDDNDAWRMSVHVPGVVHKTVNINGRMLDNIELPGEQNLALDGEALLPQLTRVLALRNAGDPELEILFDNWEELDGSYELELRKDSDQSDALSNNYMSRDSYQPASPFTISSVQNMGGVRLVTVRINAARYNPVSRKVEVLRDVDLRVRESGTLNPVRPITEVNAVILRPLVENWDALDLDDNVVRGTLLYIINSTIAAGGSYTVNIDKLQSWHERKGHKVEVAVQGAEITNWSNAGIKNYIQSRYDNADPPLEYVLLVGDANGTSLIPHWTAGSYGTSDYEYSLLEGSDLVCDIGVGRLCFADATELAIQTNKILRYERTPAAVDVGSNPDWYRSGGVFATDENHSGVSTIHTCRTVRARMLDAGYNSANIDTIYYKDYGNPPSSAFTTASFNSGISVFVHRGYLGTLQYDIGALTNDDGDWPFMMNVTCGTNDYDGTDECEHFVNAGSALNPEGVIAAIGMSTLSTNTRYNNCMVAGGMQGLMVEGAHTAGAVLNRSRFEILDSYLPDPGNQVEFFCGIMNLIGDPSVDIFTGTPDDLQTNAPATAPIGTNSMTITVTNQLAQPVEDAYVNLVKDGEVFIGGFTDASGQVTLHFSTSSADSLHVTATKHNCRPAHDYTLIQSSTGFVSPASNTFAAVNPGQAVDLPVQLRNWGSSSVSSVVGTLSSTDPFVASITDNSESYGTIAAGATDNPPDDFDFNVAAYVPHGHELQFTLTVTSSAGTNISGIAIPVENGNYEYDSYTLTGGSGDYDLVVTLENIGGRMISAASATLTSLSSSIIVDDANGSFTSAGVGATASNSGDHFGILTNDTYPGEHCTMRVVFPLAGGFADTVLFDVIIGSTASNTPTPPDEYGYWAFDNTDTAYPKAPTYNWVEIDPNYGGDGTPVAIYDAEDEADDAAVISLPFTFTFYGQDYDDISICSNGFLAMGADQVEYQDHRNYFLPSAVGANAMIAPFWDDLRVEPYVPSRAAGAEIDPMQYERELRNREVATEIDELRARRNTASKAELSSIDSRLETLYDEIGFERPVHPGGTLDQGSETCTGATVISSFPYNVTGVLGSSTDCEDTGSTSPTWDVFYVMTAPETGNYTFDMCGSENDTYLKLWLDGSCCSGATATNDDACGEQDPILTIALTEDQVVYVECGNYYTQATGGGSYNLNIDYVATGDPCETATVIASIPATVSGSTTGQPALYTPVLCGSGNSPDVFYRYTATTTETADVSLCLGTTNYDAKIAILENGVEAYCSDDDCSNPPVYTNNWIPHIEDVQFTSGNEYCFVVTGYGSSSSGNFTMYIGIPVGRCCYGDPGDPDCVDEVTEVYCQTLDGNWTAGATCADGCPIPEHVYTKHDATNHRFIIEWSRVWKYGGSNPDETFQAILYEPGYPATPTGDGEILFQYFDVTNSEDVYASNDYATVGIENHTNDIGLTYSYWNQQDPDIPGSAGLIDGRAILFTTDSGRDIAAAPAAVEDLTVIRSGDNIELSWSPVTEDENGSPMTVDGYRIYGGGTSDITHMMTELIHTTSSTSWTDTAGLTRDIYFYLVVAYKN